MNHSEMIMNPTGGVDVRRSITQPSLHENLMDLVVNRDNMQRAWKHVKANKGAPGIDRMRIVDFPAFAKENWTTIRQALLEGTCQPTTLRRVTIPKPGGRRLRMLGIPAVLDRLITQAISQVLTPIFDPGFSELSFGSRPKRSAHGALRQVQHYIREGYCIAVDLDLEKFFDKVGHDVLMSRIARKVRDKTLLALIGRYLRAGVQVGNTIHATGIGTPQGSPLSPLLANIMLDDLDKELERRGHCFVRYVDDMLILVRSIRAGQRVKASITRYLITRLKLVVNEEKSWVAKINECVFLGFTFRGSKLRWSAQAYMDFRHRIRELTGRSWGVSMVYRFRKLKEYLRG